MKRYALLFSNADDGFFYAVSVQNYLRGERYRDLNDLPRLIGSKKQGEKLLQDARQRLDELIREDEIGLTAVELDEVTE